MVAVTYTAEVRQWIGGIINPQVRARVLVGIAELPYLDIRETCGFGLKSIDFPYADSTKLYFRQADKLDMLSVSKPRLEQQSAPFPGSMNAAGEVLAAFDPIKYLDDEAAILSYLIESQKTSSTLRMIALHTASRARFINQLAIQACIGRADTYDFLQSNNSITFVSVTKLLSALKSQRLIPLVSA